MSKNNPYFPKLPETATISYYNPETEENIFLSREQLGNLMNSGEFRLVDKKKDYRSWKADVDYSAYGPMFAENSEQSRNSRDNQHKFVIRIRHNILFSFSDGKITNDHEVKGIDGIRNFLQQMEKGEVKILISDSFLKGENKRSKYVENEVKKILNETVVREETESNTQNTQSNHHENSVPVGYCLIPITFYDIDHWITREISYKTR